LLKTEDILRAEAVAIRLEPSNLTSGELPVCVCGRERSSCNLL